MSHHESSAESTEKLDFRRFADVASRELGGSVLYASDDFYGDVHQLIAPTRATHDPSTFGPRGKVYDGWETRRRRDSGADVVIIRLATPCIVHGINVDTSFFTGNFPASASLATTMLLGYPDVDEVLTADWQPAIDKADLEGDSANILPVATPRLATHVKLTIHPDGGVARLRVFGEIVPDPRRMGGWVDVAALLNGGLVDACSNMFYSSPANVLKPGWAQVMSDGWETARRRGEGNDWLIIRLACAAVIHDVVIDTQRFVGNSPGWASMSDADTGAELMPVTKLVPDTEHHFRIAATATATATVERVRLDIYPDGGISRLRVHGTVPKRLHATMSERWLTLLPPEVAAQIDRDQFFS